METPEISSTEEQMKSYYESLSEKDRRRYAAIEATKLGYGGLGQIGKLSAILSLKLLYCFKAFISHSTAISDS